MKCDKCGKELKPDEEHFIGGSSELSPGVKEKPGFYCWPCYKEKRKEQWTALFVGLIIAFIVIIFWFYVLSKLFKKVAKKSKRRQ